MQGDNFLLCTDSNKSCAALSLRNMGGGCIFLFWAMDDVAIIEEAAEIRLHQAQFYRGSE